MIIYAKIYYSCYSMQHKRSQKFFLWGVHRKSFFLVAALETQAETTKLTTPIIQISPISSKNWTLALPRGYTLCLAMHLQLFPCKFCPHFFIRPGVARATSALAGYAYALQCCLY